MPRRLRRAETSAPHGPRPPRARTTAGQAWPGEVSTRRGPAHQVGTTARWVWPGEVSMRRRPRHQVATTARSACPVDVSTRRRPHQVLVTARWAWRPRVSAGPRRHPPGARRRSRRTLHGRDSAIHSGGSAGAICRTHRRSDCRADSRVRTESARSSIRCRRDRPSPCRSGRASSRPGPLRPSLSITRACRQARKLGSSRERLTRSRCRTLRDGASRSGWPPRYGCPRPGRLAAWRSLGEGF